MLRVSTWSFHTVNTYQNVFRATLNTQHVQSFFYNIPRVKHRLTTSDLNDSRNQCVRELHLHGLVRDSFQELSRYPGGTVDTLSSHNAFSSGEGIELGAYIDAEAVCGEVLDMDIWSCLAWSQSSFARSYRS